MIKTITSILFVMLSIFTFGQTSEEMTMITEINKIRKDPKSYIPVVEGYIETQNKAIEFMSRPNVKVTVKSTEVKSDKNNNLVPTGKTTLGKSVYHKRIAVAKELITLLETMEPLDTLVFDSTMYGVTKTHGLYLTSINRIGHYDKDGNKPYVRFKDIGNVSENVASSGGSALLMLMVDYGVPNRGHRNNILNPNINYISVFINDHCVVQNFME
jgi:uncharacterized protein YkwD